jgi:hypothetical protein
MIEYISSEEFSRGLRRRIIVLLLLSTLVVAVMFGLSFYFALVSNETAVAGQVPELEAVVGKLKRILITNTVTFAAVIIASLYALSSLITTRMFRPLESVMRDMLAIGQGKLPDQRAPYREEPFAGFDEMFGQVLSVLKEREKREIEEINQCLSVLSNPAAGKEVRCKLEKILKEKGVFIGSSENDVAYVSSEKTEEDELFLQPV